MPHSPRRRSVSCTAAVLAAAATVVLTAACSGGSTGGSTSYTPPKSDTKASITYAIWDDTQKKGIDANISSFHKLYPNISVNVTVTPWEDYWTKLQTQASSNTLPDVFWMNDANLPLYASAKKLAPITPLVQSKQVSLADYPSALVDSYVWQGVHYGVPKDFDTIAVWYNPALFAKAGVPIPDGTWDWQTFTDTAKKLREALKPDGDYGVTAEISGSNALYSTLWQAGGTILSPDKKSSAIDSPATISAIEFWQELASSGAMPSVQQMSDTSALDWFGNGKSAMYVSGSWDRTAIVDSSVGTAVGVLPQPRGKVKATLTGGLANVVAAGSKNMDAARAFQAFLATKTAQKEQGDLGSVIPAFTGTQQGWLDTMPNTKLSVFIDGLAYAKSEPVTMNTMAWSTPIDNIMLKAVGGQLSAEAAAKQMATEIDTALKKEK